MHALKGHGTGNDFIVLPDLDGALTLTPDFVRAVCNRSAGIGADGVLRVVRSENDDEAKKYAADAEFFMDYRNADGSVAEMCGNGIRVFLRYLQRVSLVGEVAAVATRGGIMSVRSGSDGDIRVQMGLPRVLADRPVATVAPDFGRMALAAVLMPNPHVVVPVTAAELAGLDLTVAPLVDPPLPDGQNVEFVVTLAPRHLRMRVFERGVGETQSCGTGICAAVVAAADAASDRPEDAADGATWQVDVPGGTCRVIWHRDGHVELIGPAVIVADLDIDHGWLDTLAGQRDAH